FGRRGDGVLAGPGHGPDSPLTTVSNRCRVRRVVLGCAVRQIVWDYKGEPFDARSHDEGRTGRNTAGDGPEHGRLHKPSAVAHGHLSVPRQHTSVRSAEGRQGRLLARGVRPAPSRGLAVVT